MNLLQQLMMANRPGRPVERPEPKARSGNPKPDHVNANSAKSQYAIAKYKAVMTEEWTPTNVIERRLGATRGVCFKTLTKWESSGLLVRRPAGGVFNRRMGWEWKWIK